MTDDNKFKTLYEAGAVNRGEPITASRQQKIVHSLDEIRLLMREQTELMDE